MPDSTDLLSLTHLHTALDLAERAIGLSDPNPRVGCVLTAPDGRVIGQGHTQAAGGPHAEVMALRDAAQHGEPTAGSTAWVTLEPCSHHGRTPPCCDALIAAGCARGVALMRDPNPLVAGQGLARLRAAGLTVLALDEAPDDEARALLARAHDLNIGFFARMTRGRPWLRLKLASSMDGRSALPDGQSQWITGPEARHDGHGWRRRASALVTGIGTVLADDPTFTVRGWPCERPPLRVVLDRHLRTPPTHRIAQIGKADPATPGTQVYAHAATLADSAGRERQMRLEQQGVSVLAWPGTQAHDPASAARLDDLAESWSELGWNEVHIEAGSRLAGAFWQAGLIDEVLHYLAPSYLGPGQPVLNLPDLPALPALPLAWRVAQALPLGQDTLLRLRRV
ncbi:bifunctional diaminohydroxyphosphoribosylaminopyrimidine deaminase/5-amino-6-(5-phosphoribosylamino)uracil reductase RibD [Amphibiibacter pelophylacis]|uniref:Bifunctional diaminohydroxyphosphoribosylaminopyrimidine deaminase/5-amino-6-(5-phosphoribosylamino)uracil reductase RibD n=1 Tax=Amphibiibacter pelophylacis TaxID=1799477 RepID=A0ACC6P5F8_9BURK